VVSNSEGIGECRSFHRVDKVSQMLTFLTMHFSRTRFHTGG